MKTIKSIFLNFKVFIQKALRELSYFSFLIFSLFVVFCLFQIVGNKISEPIKDFWIPALAAFFGSITAFSLTFYHESKKGFKDNLLELKKLQFTLYAQQQHLLINYQEFLKNLNPISTTIFLQSNFIPALDFQALIFILETSKPNLLNKLLAVQRTFMSFQELLEQRNSFILSVRGQLYTEIAEELRGRTTALMTSFENAWRENSESINEVNGFLKNKYWDCIVLDFPLSKECEETNTELNNLYFKPKS